MRSEREDDGEIQRSALPRIRPGREGSEEPSGARPRRRIHIWLGRAGVTATSPAQAGRARQPAGHPIRPAGPERLPESSPRPRPRGNSALKRYARRRYRIKPVMSKALTRMSVREFVEKRTKSPNGRVG